MKFKLINIVFAIFTFASIMNSCDIIEAPYEEDGGNQQIDTASKVVLMEEYTGFRCGNCPTAGDIAHEIKAKYPDNVVLLSIHAGSLALPTPKHPYNFISQVMKDLDAKYQISLAGTPNGLVDRISYNGALILPPGDWESAVLERTKIPANVKITLTPSYNETTKTISCSAAMKFLDDAPSSYQLALYVVEDSIVQYQTDYRLAPNVDVEDFVHNNIVRDALTNSFGEKISDETISKGSEIIKQYSKTIPETADWRPEWIRIVAVLMDVNNDYEVVQCGEKYILR
ncbi:MAG: hypothetical protein A2X64_04525 [Ignavibacteria bacterium GWF2_33_9]|nr:MAG: hypothetical protein A2X64_04525 [Ignavibacteria bacterium GWF2_33_9]